MGTGDGTSGRAGAKAHASGGAILAEPKGLGNTAVCVPHDLAYLPCLTLGDRAAWPTAWHVGTVILKKIAYSHLARQSSTRAGVAWGSKLPSWARQAGAHRSTWWYLPVCALLGAASGRTKYQAF